MTSVSAQQDRSSRIISSSGSRNLAVLTPSVRVSSALASTRSGGSISAQRPGSNSLGWCHVGRLREFFVFRARRCSCSALYRICRSSCRARMAPSSCKTPRGNGTSTQGSLVWTGEPRAMHVCFATLREPSLWRGSPCHPAESRGSELYRNPAPGVESSCHPLVALAATRPGRLLPHG